MIKNEKIRNRIEEKTKDNPTMRSFLTEIIVFEQIGGNHSKKYKQEIEKAVKKEGGASK